MGTKSSKSLLLIIGDSILSWIPPSVLEDLEDGTGLVCDNQAIPGLTIHELMNRWDRGMLAGVGGKASGVKAVLVNGGTNNFHDTAENVAETVLLVLRKVRETYPIVPIVYLGILPKGKEPNQYREKDTISNNLINEGTKDFPRFVFLEPEQYGFVDEQGAINSSTMPDFLHLSNSAYEKVISSIIKAFKPYL